MTSRKEVNKIFGDLESLANALPSGSDKEWLNALIEVGSKAVRATDHIDAWFDHEGLEGVNGEIIADLLSYIIYVTNEFFSGGGIGKDTQTMVGMVETALVSAFQLGKAAGRGDVK